MSIQLQPSVPLVTLVKSEPPTVIKNEPPEEALEKQMSPDIKDIDIVYHSFSEDLIKSEIVPENMLETKYLEFVQTQVLVKTEDTSDENVTRGTGQEVIEVQGSNEYPNVLSNLEIDAQLVLNFSKDLNGISIRTRKTKHPEKTNFAKCYKTVETTSWEKDKEKIYIIKAPVILVKPHEYTSLAKDRHVCNHCQHACNRLDHLKLHIKQMHREVTTMYQCPYCPFKSKWKQCIINQHIILKHKDTKDIQWFQCNLCEMKFKLKKSLTRHMKVHLRHKQMKDGLDLCETRYGCNKCNYGTYTSTYLKRHNLIHLKPEEIEYFYCYHCSYKCQRKDQLKAHIFRHHFKNIRQGKRFGCNKCDYETYTSTNLKIHKLSHLKPEEIQYFYCYHCSYKANRKDTLKIHIFRHFKNIRQGKRFGCNKCNYETYTSTNLKIHKLSHLKPEEIQYFYCYHCSYKANRKDTLKIHIFRHFIKEQVEFECYICNFMTPKRELIIKHIKKHFKVQNKFEINEGS